MALEITPEMIAILNKDFLIKGATAKEAIRRVFALAELQKEIKTESVTGLETAIARMEKLKEAYQSRSALDQGRRQILEYMIEFCGNLKE